MTTWFDRLAQRTARSSHSRAAAVAEAPVEEIGLSRRQVLARGAVLTGAAWTAPALLAARPAFAGASICVPGSSTPVYSVCGNGSELCCPEGEECVVNQQGDYVCDVPPGGECTNRGNGQCNGGFSRCDQPSNTARFGICGGPGTACADDSACEFDNCGELEGSGVQGRRCGGLNAVCEDTGPDEPDQCAPPDANQPADYDCVNGRCQPVA